MFHAKYKWNWSMGFYHMEWWKTWVTSQLPQLPQLSLLPCSLWGISWSPRAVKHQIRYKLRLKNSWALTIYYNIGQPDSSNLIDEINAWFVLIIRKTLMKGANKWILQQRITWHQDKFKGTLLILFVFYWLNCWLNFLNHSCCFNTKLKYFIV
jgi:hypothetical protein